MAKLAVSFTLSAVENRGGRKRLLNDSRRPTERRTDGVSGKACGRQTDRRTDIQSERMTGARKDVSAAVVADDLLPRLNRL